MPYWYRWLIFLSSTFYGKSQVNALQKTVPKVWFSTLFFIVSRARKVGKSTSDMWYCRIWLTSRAHKYHVSFAEMCILIICVFLGSNIGFRKQSKHEYNLMGRIKFRIVHCNTYFVASIFGCFFSTLFLLFTELPSYLHQHEILCRHYFFFFSSPLVVINIKVGVN